MQISLAIRVGFPNQNEGLDIFLTRCFRHPMSLAGNTTASWLKTSRMFARRASRAAIFRFAPVAPPDGPTIGIVDLSQAIGVVAPLPNSPRPVELSSRWDPLLHSSCRVLP